MAVSSTGAVPRRPGLWGVGSGVWMWGLLALAGLGFWKTYFSRLGLADAVTHLHAGLMLAWMAMLLVQSWLIRTRRVALHRQIGQFSYGVMPGVVLTALWLSHLRMAAAPAEMFGLQAMLLYLGMAASLMLALFWGLAIRHRRDPARHARYMVATALVMIDPAMARLVLALLPEGVRFNPSWGGYAVTFVVLGLLMGFERRTPHGRGVFPFVTAVFAINFVLMHLVPGTQEWQTFARWWGTFGG
ncbi:hypothetical protein [Pseudoxanthomonas sp. PXM01]|uniref:hypothetical protein n=1 Tax=Pseudoxanthomonas sp. PXM01 TaxID=2769295 RepID=UPI001784A093|nr:hypothetical protein [Pseudoxanthomonas sp. PXM01]MBD9469590.1 hypothetical protein [Pseudoxanthomonas sp. PXM01]